jgi:hypothetical protein
MHFLLLIILFQKIPDLTASHASSTSIKPPLNKSSVVIQANPSSNTTGLNLNSELVTHTQMAQAIGSQGEAIAAIKENVKTLQDNREKKDRPDIDDLKTTRSHAIWTVSVFTTFIFTVGGLLWWAKGFIWNDTIRPKLKRALIDPPEPLV